jgi:hypothetical protein
VSLSINPFTTGSTPSSVYGDPTPMPDGPGAFSCPACAAEFAPFEDSWQTCPYCSKRLQVRRWPIVRHNTAASAALADHATCFFHPDKAFQACCQRCGRFVCALCALQLGAEHVCPACFERGRTDSGGESGKAEWRHRDVLYDSIALSRVGLDSFLACHCSCDTRSDLLTCEAPEGAPLVLDWPIGVAFLGGLSGNHLGAAIIWDLHPRNSSGGETLIDKYFSENIARGQP